MPEAPETNKQTFRPVSKYNWIDTSCSISFTNILFADQIYSINLLSIIYLCLISSHWLNFIMLLILKSEIFICWRTNKENKGSSKKTKQKNQREPSIPVSSKIFINVFFT